MKNYMTVLEKDNLVTGAYITVARTVVGTVLSLVTNAILAYIVSRKRFLFKQQLSVYIVNKISNVVYYRIHYFGFFRQKNSFRQSQSTRTAGISSIL